MAMEHGMIEPFADGQVGEGVISYGLSSYGYDMRVTDEFKVFTNVFNVVVDPKAFNPRSFVDVQADYCDIPPNSFALARSLEYFRIPRDVCCIVMGKSTYARCFRGDTKVALVNGTAISLEDMAVRSEKGEQFLGYSVGEQGQIIPAMLEKPRYIGRDTLMGMVLDNGETIHCTPDHEFMLRDGHMVAAEKLRPGTSLMPLYRDIFHGYEGVYQPRTGHFTPMPCLADKWHGNMSCFPAAIAPFRSMQSNNHKIVELFDVPGDHDVYCLTVPETGNFALEAGVFVSNCGIIVNVTPLEPEWNGYVTIEISNTTPLPARIYANEGIGQVIFLAGNQLCEVSYADRKGKYQHQQGIVLPHINT
jgi:deoxycytidine triphosphate deaminase